MNSSEAVPETLTEVLAPVEPTTPPEKREFSVAEKYYILTKQIRRLVKAVGSRGGLERVLFAVADFPLMTEKPRLLSEDEWLLYEAYQNMLNNKFELISTILAEQAHKAATENKELETQKGEINE